MICKIIDTPTGNDYIKMRAKGFEKNDESRLLEILDKFTIEAAKTSIDGISNEFSKNVGHIPSENRDGYIGALLGEILIKVKDSPHKWEVTKSEFDEILQIQSAAYGTKGTAPLPNEYAKAVVPKDKITTLEQKNLLHLLFFCNSGQFTDAFGYVF